MTELDEHSGLRLDVGLRDHVMLVTGATRGLGRAAARELAGQGARLVVSSRDAEAVRRTAEELGGPPNTLGVAADNAASDAAQRLVEAALAGHGRLDGVLVSVGGPPAGTACDTGDDVWREAFESVFLGAVRLARTAAPVLTSGGCIAFILSATVRSPLPGLAVSGGLRPGLAMAAKYLADELGPRGIRVLGLLPAWIDTDRARQLDARGGDPAGARARNTATIPLRRYGSPEEFGKVAAFVLSPAASFLTGCVIPVDGGALRVL